MSLRRPGSGGCVDEHDAGQIQLTSNNLIGFPCGADGRNHVTHISYCLLEYLLKRETFFPTMYPTGEIFGRLVA